MEGLEEAAKEIATDILGKDYLSELDEEFAIDALNEAKKLVKAGAEWQKEQDDLEAADLLAIAHLQGMEQQKAKMMEDAAKI